QCFVGELFNILFERVDLLHARLIAFDASLIGGAEQFAGERADHVIPQVSKFRLAFSPAIPDRFRWSCVAAANTCGYHPGLYSASSLHAAAVAQMRERLGF